MVFCAIKVCRNYYGRTKTCKKVTYHKIPNDQELSSRWINIIRKSRGEELWIPKKSSCVCSDHFHKKDKYFVNKEGRQRLKKGTVPHKALFLSSLQSDGSSDEATNSCEEEQNTLKETELTANVDAENCATKRDAQCPRALEEENISDAINIMVRKDEKKTLTNTENEAEELQDFPDLDYVFDTPKEEKLRRELGRKITLQKKLTLKIQSLRRKNNRLKKKIVKFKEIVRNLKQER